MTRPRLSSTQQLLDDLLGPLEGLQIPGGCDDCDAYQEVEDQGGSVWMIRVRHDPGCPELTRRRAGAA
jgi:hypothetical protein